MYNGTSSLGKPILRSRRHERESDNIVSMRPAALLGLACCALARLAFGQQASVEIPDGTRHFIVLVDRSRSMVSASPRVGGSARKAAALEQAENALAEMLFDKGWYRPSRDMITVEHFGVDFAHDAGRAYMRLANARLHEDYIGKPLGAAKSVSRSRFLEALRPKQRTCLNVLGWALPIGLREAALDASHTVQRTYVIVLNDAQMNDGSIVLERLSLDLRLNRQTYQELQRADEVLNAECRLTDAQGNPGAMSQERFGNEHDPVVITVFEVRSVATQKAAAPAAKLDALDPLTLSWAGNRLRVRWASPPEIQGNSGALVVGCSGQTESSSVHLDGRDGVLLNRPRAWGDGEAANVRLIAYGQAVNPILGSQKYAVVYRTSTHLPGVARSAGSTLAWVLFLGIIGAGAFGWWYLRNVARLIRIWSLDVEHPLELPSIHQGGTVQLSSRVPAPERSTVLYVELPPKILRHTLFRNAYMECFPPLTMGVARTRRFTALPRFVSVSWSSQEVSGDSGTIRFANGDHLLTVQVRFTRSR